MGVGSSAQQQGIGLLYVPSGMQLENSTMEIKNTVMLKGAKVLKIKNIGAPSHMGKSQLVPSNFSRFLNSLDSLKEECVFLVLYHIKCHFINNHC